MLHAARTMATAFRDRPEFEGLIIDTHHRLKRDAPSGTAIAIPRAAKEAGGRDVPITSIRTGAVPGIHELRYEGPFESLSLEHVARDRSVFGAGAVLAAEWLVGRTGVFTFEDVLFGKRT